VIDALTAAGGPPPIVSGSGTGSHRIDAELGIFTEFQVGSYVFMDGQYLVCDIAGDGADKVPTRLPADRRAGGQRQHAGHGHDRRRLQGAVDRRRTAQGAGRRAGRVALLLHGRRARRDPAAARNTPPGLAERVILGAPHCDPTVNLYDTYHVVEGDTLVALWPVSARGRSR
jgi:3-hydroxy-D-aspartate aldolase